MSLFSGQTTSTQNRRLLGFHPQTSISGQVLAILAGTRKLAGNVIWAGDWRSTPVSSSGKGGGKASGGGKGSGGGEYSYKMAVQMALCRGPLSQMGRVWEDKTEFRNIGGTKYRAISGSDPTSNTPLPDVDLALFAGYKGQDPWGYLTTNHADQALGYSEVAHIDSPSLDLGTSGMVPNFTWEVTGQAAPPDYNNGLDVDPSRFAYELMTHEDFGAGLVDQDVGPRTEASNYAVANGLFCSMLCDTQTSAAQWLNELSLIGNYAYVNSEGLIKFRSYGDTNVTGNGKSFAPNLTPIYDLDDDDFLAEAGEEPVSVSIPTVRDSPNYFSLEWTNRANGYNTEPIYEEDQAAIQQYGLRSNPIVQAHSICDHAVASKVCSIVAKKATYQRRTFNFRLGVQYGLLEPMDLVTLTDLYIGLNKQPVRLTTIEENENGEYDVTAEEFIDGLAAPALHPKQTTAGYGPGYFAAPGPVNPPIFFESPGQITQDIGYELLIALSGGNPNWGGCTVWESADNVSYESVGRFSGPSTMGKLSADLLNGTGDDPDTQTLSVDLTESFGQLNSVSRVDVNQYRTLLAIDSELISYQNADLTGVDKYDLTYLHRGVYGTVRTLHNAGANIASLLDAMFSFPYNQIDIGNIRYFKFTSFNRAGQQEESLADVTPYSHTILTSGTTTSTGSDGTVPPVAPATIISGNLVADPNSGIGHAFLRFDKPIADVNYRGVHVAVEAPDISSGTAFQAGVTPVGSAVVQGTDRKDLGLAFPPAPDADGHYTIEIDTGILMPRPGSAQKWRFYISAIGASYDPPIVPANQSGATPSIVLDAITPLSAIGEEYAPVVSGTDNYLYLTVTLETRFYQSSWQYQAKVVWLDPTAATDPTTIKSFAGVEVDLQLLNIQHQIVDTGGGIPLDVVLGTSVTDLSQDLVNPGIQQWLSPWRDIPAIQETHLGRVRSRNQVGDVNTIAALVTPIFGYNSPDLDEVRKDGGIGTKTGATPTPKPPETIRPVALANLKNFRCTARYDRDARGSFGLLVTPFFDYPDDDNGSLTSGILIVNAPAGSNFWQRIGRPEYGDGSPSDVSNINPQDVPDGGESWLAVIVSADVNGKAKFPDADSPLGELDTPPDFGDSPTFLLTIPAESQPLGSGIEFAPNVDEAGMSVVVRTKNPDNTPILSADGLEQYFIDVRLASLPAYLPQDDRYQGSDILAAFDGETNYDNFIELGQLGPLDVFGVYGPFTIQDGTHSVTGYALGGDGVRYNTFNVSVTPGIEAAQVIQTSTTGKLRATRIDSATLGADLYKDVTNKLNVYQIDLGKTLNSSLGSDLTKTGGVVNVGQVDLRKALSAYLSADFTASPINGIGVASVNLTKALTGSYSADFGLDGTGKFQQNQVDLSKTLTSTLQSGILGIASGKLAVTGVDFSKALGATYDNADFTLSGGRFIVNGVDLRKAISASVSSEFSTSVSAGLGVNSFSAGKITSFTTSSNFVFAGTLAASVIYTGSIVASATTSGTFNGVSLILNLNNTTTSINNASDGFSGNGISVKSNTLSRYSYISPGSMYVIGGNYRLTMSSDATAGISINLSNTTLAPLVNINSGGVSVTNGSFSVSISALSVQVSQGSQYVNVTSSGVSLSNGAGKTASVTQDYISIVNGGASTLINPGAITLTNSSGTSRSL